MDVLTPPIIMLTDFGTRDAYAGQVKAVIAAIAPAAPIIDLTHDIAPYAIDEGAWMLEVTLPLLPPRAIVLGVVDPGVGTARAEVAIGVGGRTFVGPDNGLFSALLPEASREALTAPGPLPAPEGGVAVELSDPRFHRPTVSATFHGRDIFGPSAAHLAAGVAITDLGPPRATLTAFPAFCGRPARPGVLDGYVVHIDRYGNLITTIRAHQLFPAFVLELAGHEVDRHVRTFADAPPGVPFCHVDSSGFLAIALNRGNAAQHLGVERGAPVRVRAR